MDGQKSRLENKGKSLLCSSEAKFMRGNHDVMDGSHRSSMCMYVLHIYLNTHTELCQVTDNWAWKR